MTVLYGLVHCSNTSDIAFYVYYTVKEEDTKLSQHKYTSHTSSIAKSKCFLTNAFLGKFLLLLLTTHAFPHTL